MSNRTSSYVTIREARQVLADHGIESLVRDAKLYGAMPWSRRNPDGTLESGYDWQVVPLGEHALYAWLGY